MNHASPKKSLIQVLGPGLLYAGAAVGVSHLVQSTSAGASFGYGLVWAVLIANILKYPFFEFGPRYAASTGKSLLHGYKQLGNWALVVFMLLTLTTMFIIQAAVTAVAAGLATHLSGIEFDLWIWCALLLACCLAIIVAGSYTILDRAIKLIIVVLTISTLVALVFAFASSPDKPGPFIRFDFGNVNHFAFLIALMGWMPAPLDISVWHSVWSVSKNKGESGGTVLRDALLDFRVGYWGTAILALCFLSLGALMVYGSGQEMPVSATAFAKKLIEVYTLSIGEWAYPVISIAAFTTMFSTTLTCLDAFPRVLTPVTQLLAGQEADHENKNWQHHLWLLITIAGTLVVITGFMSNMRTLVNFITTLSFLAAPFLAILNYMVIFKSSFPKEHQPGSITKYISWAGMIFLTGFGLYFLYFKFFS